MKNLTCEEKTIIFWALVDKFPEFERGRKQAKVFFSHKSKLTTILKSINKQEQEHYNLMKKIGQDINIPIPKNL